MRLEVKVGASIEKVNKVDLLEYIEEEIKENTGIDEDHLPEQ
jgi:hypothetical protein